MMKNLKKNKKQTKESRSFKKGKSQRSSKKNIKQTAPKVEEPVSKKGYEMIDIISPMFGMKEEKVETEKVNKKPPVKKSKKKIIHLFKLFHRIMEILKKRL